MQSINLQDLKGSNLLIDSIIAANKGKRISAEFGKVGYLDANTVLKDYRVKSFVIDLQNSNFCIYPDSLAAMLNAPFEQVEHILVLSIQILN